MLKWTVGQRGGAAGDGRTPSAGGGPCYSIRRAAARLYQSRRSRTPSRARADKENRHLAAAHGGSEVQSLTPRTRDSVYMRLDALPAALRDVSNHLQEGRHSSSAESPAKRGRRSASRSRRISRGLKHAGDGTHEATTTPRRNIHRSAIVPCPDLSPGHRGPKRTRLSQGELSFACSSDQSMVTLQPEPPTMQIDYSPCPLRTTKSLIALRRRLEDTFSQTHHSVGTLHPTPHHSVDNPLYYTLSGRTSNIPQCSGDDIPAKIRRKNIASYSNDISWDITPSKTLDSDESVPVPPCSLNRLGKANSPQVSMLATNMAKLNLNTVVGNSACPVTSPYLSLFTSTTLSSADKIREAANQKGKARLGINHDVTDPRFLSHFSIMESTVPAASNPHDLPGLSPCIPSQENGNGTGNLAHSITSPHELTDRNTSRSSQHEEYTIKQGFSRNTSSLGSVDVVSPSEKVLSDEIKALKSNSSHDKKCTSQKVVLNIRDCHLGIVNESSFSENHGEQVRDREIIVSPSTLPKGNTVNNSVNDSSYKCEGVCDSLVSNKNEMCEFNKSADSLERSFSLRRQGGFRRRQRPQVLSDVKVNSSAMNSVTPRTRLSCSLLGVMDTSSQCTSLNASLIPNAPSSVGSTFGGPRCSLSRQSRGQDGSSGSKDLVLAVPRSSSGRRVNPKRFGLTLSQGIPSPPSPNCCGHGEDDITHSLGVKPLAESPRREATATDTTVAVWRGRRDADDGPVWRRNERLLNALRADGNQASSPTSSSDETWNSHTMHFLKTPQLTSCHILEGATYTTPSSSANTSASRTDHDVSASPVALVEQRSRSRRCLMFASPGSSTKHKRVLALRRPSSRRRSRDCHCSQQKGELELAVYANSGLLTIHVIRGWNLHKAGGKSCNAYVKVNLVPSCEERTFHRTSVQRDTSNPWFDQKFSFEVLDSDLDKRVLVSVWHRDKDRRRSEFLGCMSFAVKHAVKKDIGGAFRLLSQSSGQTQHQPAAMSRQSVSSSEEVISLDSDVPATPKTDMERRKSCTKKPIQSKAATAVQPAGNDDSSFLRHLELEPADPETGRAPGAFKGGRTPFTSTRRLSRHSKGGFGFSIAWTQPPRVERVEAGQPADRAGLRPGDYVIFVEKHNVVTMPEDEILNLIRSCGNQLTLEVYRRATPNGLVRGLAAADAGSAAPSRSPAAARSSATTCSATSASLDLSKRRLHLPQVTFSSEVGTGVIV